MPCPTEHPSSCACFTVASWWQPIISHTVPGCALQAAGEPYKLEILDSILERDPQAPITIYHIGASQSGTAGFVGEDAGSPLLFRNGCLVAWLLGGACIALAVLCELSVPACWLPHRHPWQRGSLVGPVRWAPCGSHRRHPSRCPGPGICSRSA